jgi:hypothetical protein
MLTFYKTFTKGAAPESAESTNSTTSVGVNYQLSIVNYQFGMCLGFPRRHYFITVAQGCQRFWGGEAAGFGIVA